MLGLNRSASEKPCNTIDTLIGVGTELRGDIVFTGGLRIDGKLKGNITAKADGNSTLVLSENAVVIGNVSVPHIISNGAINGNVRASERIELQSKAAIMGDVGYKSMEMALGATINGSLTRVVGETGQDKAQVTRLKPVATGSGPDTSGS